MCRPLLCAVLAVVIPCLGQRDAAALELRPGQEVGLAIDAAVAAGSIVSIVGNAVTLAQRTPQRGWILSSYFFGTLNMVIAPLLLVYGRDPSPAFGLAMGTMHGVVGVVNFSLGVWGGVLWRRARRAEGGGTALSLVPIGGHDGAARPLAGLGLRLSRW
ncbi:MAG: hypothetical protein RMK29_02035 [Myxococcales bacterium]|nr:hypothetical protein [Myxococcota bacterium]MDW8280461.1 hypothetical protein [Myxococcales bacterium]